MEKAKSGHRTISGRKVNAGTPAGPQMSRFAKTNPRSRAINRSSRASDDSSFADEIYRELNPQGPLERLVADQVVHSARKLRANLEKQSARGASEKSDPDEGASKPRARATETDRASRALREALESLDYLRAHPRPVAPAVVEGLETVEFDMLSNEWPVVPFAEADDGPGLIPPDDEVEEEVPSWHDRLVYDFDVSEISPVVKGTWVTVGHVVSLIVDGWTWADILRSHPELIEADIRTCVAYAMAEENTAP